MVGEKSLSFAEILFGGWHRHILPPAAAKLNIF